MIFAKIIGTAWMLVWFFILLRKMVDRVNDKPDEIAESFTVNLSIWLIVGLAPVAIVKFAWGFIG